jgi:hypothetical protein
MVEGTKQDRCATKWFHYPCVDVYPGDDTSQWICPDCTAGIITQQDREQEMEERQANGELEGEEEELEQRQYVSDGAPGFFISEGSELPQASPVPGPQTAAVISSPVHLTEQASINVATSQDEIDHSSRIVSPYVRARSPSAHLASFANAASSASSPSASRQSAASGFSQPQVAAPFHDATLLDHVNRTSASQVKTAGGIPSVASPRKRKSEDHTDSSSHKKAKTSEDAHSEHIAPTSTDHQPFTNDHSSDDEEALAILSETIGNAHSDLPAVGASRDAPIDLADDDDEEFTSAQEEVSSDDGEPELNHYCIAACTRETGAMVKCDNDCVGEWFHWACVGLKSKPSTSRNWYCHDCRKERHDARVAEWRSKKSATRQRAQSAKTSAKLKRRTPTPETEEQPKYCICGTPADNDMIACDGTNCEQEWFHFACVGLTAATVPEGEWYCDDCAQVIDKKEKKKSAKGKRRG